MKHIWYIDDDNFNFGEGYVFDDYENYEDNFVYKNEIQKHILGIFKTENIFDNKETAVNIYNGMINIQRAKISSEISKLRKYNEELFDKYIYTN